MRAYLLIGLFVVGMLIISGCGPEKQIVEEDKAKPGGEQEATMVSVSPASVSVNNGDIVTLDITVSNVADMLGFQFNVVYNPGVLEFQEVKEGNFLSNNGKDSPFCSEYKSLPGFINNFVCVRFGKIGVNGNGVLETFTFKAISSGESDIILSNVKLANSDSKPITTLVSDGKVVVR